MSNKLKWADGGMYTTKTKNKSLLRWNDWIATADSSIYHLKKLCFIVTCPVFDKRSAKPHCDIHNTSLLKLQMLPNQRCKLVHLFFVRDVMFPIMIQQEGKLCSCYIQDISSSTHQDFGLLGLEICSCLGITSVQLWLLFIASGKICQSNEGNSSSSTAPKLEWKKITIKNPTIFSIQETNKKNNDQSYCNKLPQWAALL